MDNPFQMSSKHHYRPGATIWVSTFPQPGGTLWHTSVTYNCSSSSNKWPCETPTPDTEGRHHVSRRWAMNLHITHSHPRHFSILQGGSTSICTGHCIQRTPVHSWWAADLNHLQCVATASHPPAQPAHGTTQSRSSIMSFFSGNIHVQVSKRLYMSFWDTVPHAVHLTLLTMAPMVIPRATRCSNSVHGKAITVSADRIKPGFMVNEMKHITTTIMPPPTPLRLSFSSLHHLSILLCGGWGWCRNFPLQLRNGPIIWLYCESS